MKKKRIIILSYILLFLVSTTGLPVTFHFCNMMEQKSLSECEMCKAEMEKVVSNCCVNESKNYAVTISTDNSVCCQDEFIFNKVKDEFIFNKSDVTYFSSSEILLQLISIISPTVDISLTDSFYSDSSPPFLINPEIHITNSALLI